MEGKKELIKLHDSEHGQMRVVGLMSGSGSNLREIIKAERWLLGEVGRSPYHVAAIFSDCYDSNAPAIGKDFDIPVIVRDVKAFHKARGKKRSDMDVRREFDKETVRALSPFDIHVAAYAGYMSIATSPLIIAYRGVNVHPADLSICYEDGRRKYTGDHAVRDAILAGEKTICSSTHLVEDKVDYGRILMISAPLEVRLDDDFCPTNRASVEKAESENQCRLKEEGDWAIFPKTLLYLAEGKYAKDENNEIYFDGKRAIPTGVKMEGRTIER
jgi:phosphoribosylglycinamide formyltransferase-1